MKYLLNALLLLSFSACFSGEPEPIANVGVRDYEVLLKRCNGNSCCEASARKIKQIKGFALKNNTSCPKGYRRNLMKCRSSYSWCEPFPLKKLK